METENIKLKKNIIVVSKELYLKKDSASYDYSNLNILEYQKLETTEINLRRILAKKELIMKTNCYILLFLEIQTMQTDTVLTR